MTDDWRKPYRTRDASGCQTDAAIVGWNWITDVASERIAGGDDAFDFHIEQHGHSVALYRSVELIAVATTFRDPVNFAVLIRWKADA